MTTQGPEGSTVRNEDYFAQELEKIGPDVVGLQEVHFDASNRGDSQLRRLAEALDMCVLGEEAPFHESHIDSRYFLGLGMLATKELAANLVQVRRVPLQTPAGKLTLPNGEPAMGHPRWAMAADFGDFAVATMHHWSLYRFGRSYREVDKNLTYLLRVDFERLYYYEVLPKDKPYALAGDFNDEEPLENQIPVLAEDHQLYELLPDKDTQNQEGSRPDHIYARGFDLDKADVVPGLSEHKACYARLRMTGVPA